MPLYPGHDDRRCAVTSHDVRRLCDSCRDDPANADWIEVWEGIETRLDDGADQDRLHHRKRGAMLPDGVRSMADLHTQPCRPIGDLEHRIIQLTLYGVKVPCLRGKRVGQRRRLVVRNIGARVQYLSSKEIAIRLGCAQNFVRQIQKRHWF